MSSSSSKQLLETRDEGCPAVQRILKGDESRFEMVPFEKFNAIARLRSQHYNGSYVICHENSLRSAGWLLCVYVKNGGCLLQKALYGFKTVQGDTSRLEKDTNGHKNCSSTVRFRRQLPAAARHKVARAAALAASLYI